jgi:hypothetical protein
MMAGAVILYFARGGESMLMNNGRGSGSLTLGEPALGFMFLLSVPLGIGCESACYVTCPLMKRWLIHSSRVRVYWLADCLWGSVVLAISFVLLQGPYMVTQNPVAEGYRFAFPVLGAFLLSVALMFQLICPKSLLSARRERNRAAAAQANLQGMMDEDLSIVRVSAGSIACVSAAVLTATSELHVCVAGRCRWMSPRQPRAFESHENCRG